MLISCQMTSNFAEWLSVELESRGLSAADLARMTRRDQGVYSRILNSERKPHPDTLEAIAHALKLPPEIVFRAAGILPPRPPDDEWLEKMNHKLNLINPPDRPMAEKLLDTLIEKTPAPKVTGVRVKPRIAKGNS